MVQDVKVLLRKIQKKRKVLKSGDEVQNLNQLIFMIYESDLTSKDIKNLLVERIVRSEFVSFAIYIFDNLLSISKNSGYIYLEYILSGFVETFRKDSKKINYIIDDLDGIGEPHYNFVRNSVKRFIANLLVAFQSLESEENKLLILDCFKWWFRGKDLECVSQIDILSI